MRATVAARTMPEGIAEVVEATAATLVAFARPQGIVMAMPVRFFIGEALPTVVVARRLLPRLRRAPS